MKYSNLLFLGILLYFIPLSYSQSDRYCKAVFEEITLTEDIVYGYADSYDWWGSYEPEPLIFNFYEPKGDSISQRPLVLMVHGGVFLIGHPKAKKDVIAWCDSLTHQGYVCAAISYRLGFNVLSKASMIRAGYRAIQDVRAAVRYFKEHHEEYRIDTTKIFVGGNSSGSIAAVNAAFMEESERPIETYGVGRGRESCDLECLDCSGNDYPHSSKVAGVISLWGAIWEPDLIDSYERIPTLMVHGTKDRVVPIGSAKPFHLPLFPTLHGSKVMHKQMKEMGIPHYYHPFHNRIHTFYHTRPLFNFPNKQWENVWNLGRDFLYEQVVSEGEVSSTLQSKNWDFDKQNSPE